MAGSVVSSPGKVLTVTLSATTTILADGDVIADTQEIPDAFLRPGGQLLLHSVTLLDQDDQGTAIDLYFLNDSGSIGTENAAISVTDAIAQGILGHVSIAAGDFVNLINSQLATKTNVGIMMQAASSDTSLYIAAVVRSGTPTYTASGIIVQLGVLWTA